MHEGSPGHTPKPGEKIKVGTGSSYSDESGKLEVWGPPGLDATISKRDYVFDVCGTERPVTEACAEYLAALEQMVAQFEADTSS